MDRHPVVLEEVVEAVAVGRDEAGLLEHGRVGELGGERLERRDADGERAEVDPGHHRQHEELAEGEDGEDGRLERPAELAVFAGALARAPADDEGAEDRGVDDPEEERALLPGPRRGEREVGREVVRRVGVDVGVLVLVRPEEVDQQPEGDRARAERDEPRLPADPFPPRLVGRGPGGLEVGDAGEGRRDEGDEDEQVSDNSDHSTVCDSVTR